MSYPKGDPFNFLGIRDDICSLENAKVVLLPIPYEATTSFIKGTSFAPFRIIEVSDYLELYEEEMGWEPWKIGISTLEPLEIIHEKGKMMERVESATKWILSLQKFPVFIGGEHTITYPIVKVYKESNIDLSVVQLDAHADLRDVYEGTKLSHACVMRRVAELGIKVCGLGVRSISTEEVEFVRENPDKYKLFEIDEIETSDWFEEMLDFLKDNVYITIDVDIFDPSEIPSVGTPEPGGLKWKEVISILKNLTKRKKIIGADITELAPQPYNHYSEYAIAKLIYKLISFVFG
ncbi:MAG: agmatinase [Candidatus Aminicenantia bacterium]